MGAETEAQDQRFDFLLPRSVWQPQVLATNQRKNLVNSGVGLAEDLYSKQHLEVKPHVLER